VIAKKFYRFFPDLLVESIKLKTITAEEVKKKMTLEDVEELTRHLEGGKRNRGDLTLCQLGAGYSPFELNYKLPYADCIQTTQ
jgi:hypothetical protein